MEIRRSGAKVLRRVLAGAVVLIVLAPVQGTVSSGGATNPPSTRPGDSAGPVRVYSSGTCVSACEPNGPGPADGATDVSVDALLSWNVPAPIGCEGFRLLASTGGIGADLNPFSLVELATDPESEIAIDPTRSIGYLPTMDFSPDGLLYGGGSKLCLIDPSNGSAQTICQTLSTPDGTPVSLNGIAFHPNGTLYGIDWDMETDQNVFYIIDMTKCLATEVCRISASRGSVWGIDFSPKGVLYGAFSELVRFDLTKRTATIVGRRFSLPFVNDIDYAPDGFIYAVDNMESRLYKISPSTGSVVDQYGPYDSELWGVVSECTAPFCAGQPGEALLLYRSAAARAGWSTPREPGWLWYDAEEELTAMGKRGLLLERLASRDAKIAVENGAGAAPAGEASPSLQVAAAVTGVDITCDVYMDTVRPPARLIHQDVPPAAGRAWTCDHRVLRPGTTYYWRVVAKRPCGAITLGPVWSFTTKRPLAEDMQ